MTTLPFAEVWLVDFEFSALNGNRPAVRCMVAREFHTGRATRLWLHDTPPPPKAPFDVGPDSLFVAYLASAEMGCFLSLGWAMPMNILDLYVEFKRHICGRAGAPDKPSLLYALERFGITGLDAEEKAAMRQLALREGGYTHQERQDLLVYCESDVLALAQLLPKMLPTIDLPRAVLRGRYMKSVATVESNGIPIDTSTQALLDKNWEGIQEEMVKTVDVDYGVYEGLSFRMERFNQWLADRGISWPRTASGVLSLNKEVFKDMAAAYPVLQPLRQLRQAISTLRLSDLPVGNDGRNRCLLSPFGTVTGRCSPSSSDFIFGRPAWMRSLIQPEQGRALAYIDWSSQEYGIAAALSNDSTMMQDYLDGDPYLGFARRIGMVPADANKESHKAERGIMKTVTLATQYRMGDQTLAMRIGKSVDHANELLQAHRDIYHRYWKWSDGAINCALFGECLWTRFGWTVHAGPARSTERNGDPNIRSLANFPCQGNGADMLRVAVNRICENGVMLDATVHDAVLIEADEEDIEEAVDTTRKAMLHASKVVLNGFPLRTDFKVIRWPNRYRDDRGAKFFDEMVSKAKTVSQKPLANPARPWEELAFW